MAAKALDPSTCTSAAEAFKHPLPQVRQFHRSLITELDGKNARLRTLVGGSYRQLLGTAEMILQMRDDVGAVEDKLGRVGKGCGRTVVSDMAGGLGKLHGKLKEGQNVEEMGWLAKLKVLEMCVVVMGRLLRKRANTDTTDEKSGTGKNLVVAAKVWVLSRLLAKSLSNSAGKRRNGKASWVEESREKLASLKRKLLRVIENTLERTGGLDGREGLVQALCAYSLAEGSSTKDVLMHFLRIRGKAMTLAFEDDLESTRESPSILKALQLYTRTLLDFQALAPRRLPEALSSLNTKSLLKDQSIRELEGLRLDVSERWFGDEILFFKPYIRHDDLDGPLAVEYLRGWAEKASQVLLQGFAKTLHRIVEFKAVAELRTKVFELWIKDGGKSQGFDPSIILDGFREVINARMVELLESRVSKLHLVGTEIEATLGAWREGVTDKHQTLWDDDMLEMEISNGAGLFKQGVLARTHGRSDAVSRACNGYQTWRHVLDEMITMLGQLKRQRWDDDLEDIEDDLSIESRSNLLSKQDPQMLLDHLDSSLENAYSDLHEKIVALIATYQDSEQLGQISVYILRVLRDIRSKLPDNSSLQAFGLSLVPSLHMTLATIVSSKPLEGFTKPLNKKRVVGRALWEGDPELPVQPSPRVFKFLHALTWAMADVGSDVWSPAAVKVLKQHLLSELGTAWNVLLKALDKPEPAPVSEPGTNEVTLADGAEAEAEAEAEAVERDIEKVGGLEGSTEASLEVTTDPNVRKEVLVQSLFDISVLQNCLDLGKDTAGGLQAIGKSVKSQVELDTSSRKRLERGAKEYWNRTSLLFGLLA